MGGHRPASLNLFYDDLFLNLQHFDTNILNLWARLNAEKSCGQKTGQKMDFTGVEIAWVDMKSNKCPSFYIRK